MYICMYMYVQVQVHRGWQAWRWMTKFASDDRVEYVAKIEVAKDQMALYSCEMMELPK